MNTSHLNRNYVSRKEFKMNPTTVPPTNSPANLESRLAICVLLVALGMSGCASMAGSSADGSSASDPISKAAGALRDQVSDLMNPKFRKVKELYQGGKTDAAYDLYTANPSSFQDLTASQKTTIDALLKQKTVDTARKMLRDEKYIEAEVYLKQQERVLPPQDEDVRQLTEEVRALANLERLRAMIDSKQFLQAHQLIEQGKNQMTALPTEKRPQYVAMITQVYSRQFESLVDSKQYQNALELYEQNRDLLSKGGQIDRPRLDALANNLNQQFQSSSASTIARLRTLSKPEGIEQANWPTVRETLNDTNRLLDQYRKIAFMEQYRSPAYEELQQLQGQLLERLQKQASIAFSKYRIFEKNFSDEYPTNVPDHFYSLAFESVKKKLNEASPDQLSSFSRTYGKKLDSAQREHLSNLYVNALLRSKNRRGTLAALALSEEIKAAGFQPPEWPRHAAIVQIGDDNAKARLDGSPGGIPVIPGRKGDSLDELLSSSTLSDKAVVVFVYLQQAQVKGQVLSKSSVKSEYQSGVRQEQNPRYLDAQQRVQETENQYRKIQIQAQEAKNQSAQFDYSQMSGSQQFLAIAANTMVEMGQDGAERDLREAQRELSATPPTLSVPVYTPYSYTTERRSIEKSLSIKYIVLERETRKKLEGSIHSADAKQFTVLTGLHPNDKDAKGALARTQTDADIEGYAVEAIQVSYNNVWNQIQQDISRKW